MAKAINDVKVFAALLDGGYICEECNNCTDKRKYKVFEKDETAPAGSRLIGHITRRQFCNLMSENIIGYTITGFSKDKTCHYYELTKLLNRDDGEISNEKPVKTPVCWMYGETDNVFTCEIYCPMCGKPALYPEEEDRPLETDFCPHCGVQMDESVPCDPNWPFYEMSLKKMNQRCE